MAPICFEFLGEFLGNLGPTGGVMLPCGAFTFRFDVSS